MSDERKQRVSDRIAEALKVMRWGGPAVAQGKEMLEELILDERAESTLDDLDDARARIAELENESHYRGCADFEQTIIDRDRLHDKVIELKNELENCTNRESCMFEEVKELRARVRELEIERDRWRGQWDIEHHTGLEWQAKYNALREAAWKEHRVHQESYDDVGCHCSLCEYFYIESGGDVSGDVEKSGETTVVDPPAAPNNNDDAGGESQNPATVTHDVDGQRDRPAPSSSNCPCCHGNPDDWLGCRVCGGKVDNTATRIGDMIVRDGVPQRHDAVGCDGCENEAHYRRLGDAPADLPYKLAWEAFGGPETDWPAGTNVVYDVWSVGDCQDCWNIVTGGDQSKPNTTDCPTCHGNGGRYEMRAREK